MKKELNDIQLIRHGKITKSLKHGLVVEKSNQIMKRRKGLDVGEINEDGII